jgi:DNA polymerase III alpha subunit
MLKLKRESAEIPLDPAYDKRLRAEFREIDAQNEYKYFLDLYDRRVRYPYNQNNLLTPYLLHIVKDFDITKNPEYKYGEFPDIDIDYFLPELQWYLKNEWAPKTFGEGKVANVGNYATFGIKMSFQDMAKVYGESRSEIMDLTTRLGLKDDEGKVLSFKKALEIYPELKKYCEEHPDVAKAVQKLLFRNRGMGKHAGGLVISSEPIDNFVPLIKGSKDETIQTGWTEGLHAQDLQPMGLIKFDVLVVKNLFQIAKACKLIKERHGLTSICALPGRKDWSDISYLNDPKAIKMANDGELKCIFQFDSPSIRALAKQGGVDSFNDIAAYSALHRPGPLGMKMHEHYIARKKGKEHYHIHPVMEPFLAKTYGILIYQEQIMQILNAVGDIPLKDCYIVIKAIAKKKLELFGKYKDQFLRVGRQTLGYTDVEILDLWNQIESFAEYGFNKSHAVAYSYISARLLWLKAWYPLEFYAAILSCEDEKAKIKEYKTDAARHGIVVNRLDINKSKANFSIGTDGQIYYGFSNVKGIGEAAAERIVAGQPYASLQDFLERFGTTSNVLKPLMGLRVFKDDDIVTLCRYVEYYKDVMSKRESRKRRYESSSEGYREKLTKMVGETPTWSDAYFAKFQAEFEKIEHDLWTWDGEDLKCRKWNKWTELRSIWNRYKKCEEGNKTKTQDEKSTKVELRTFNPAEWELDDDYFKIKLKNEDTGKTEQHSFLEEDDAERAFYGFRWKSHLEDSPDYTGGHTFEAFKAEIDAGTANIFCVEVEVAQVIQKTAKKNPNFIFYHVRVKDANDEPQNITVWKEDMERFKEEFQAGKMLKMRIVAPSGGFRGYTFESPARQDRWRLPKKKEDDLRVVVMNPPKPSLERRALTDKEMDEAFDICVEDK